MDHTEEGSLRARKKRQTRTAIHRAALELAIAHTPERVTIDDIAARAGVSSRTFFNYFQSKDEAFVGLTGDSSGSLAAAIAARPAEEDLLSVLEVVIRDLLQVIVDDVESWKLRRMAAEVAPSLGNAMSGATARLERAIVDAAVAREGSSDVAVVVTAYAALAAMRSAFRMHVDACLRGDLIARLDASFAQLRAGFPARVAAGR
ncbi:TetR/AcrR family transcriptional regulator [Cumulibacter manganitolerans]|uniref:TetR/AcrR family transcriptional regulator n=1 Tax=Cumulibacter manganitolerans TaxID=1884992 RepID=UPI00188635D3|nr:TetR/AcrR family transcriptional regulator [Cumulibacter manganitolerans]